MITAIVYLLKVQVVFTVLFILYYAFLRREKFLRLNRFILISIVALAFALPLSRTFSIRSSYIKTLQIADNRDSAFPKFISGQSLSKSTTYADKTVARMDLTTLVMVAYLTVVAILFMVFLVNLYKVYGVISKSIRYKVGRLFFCEPFDETAPFSFFNYIVVKKDALPPVEYQQIITHECAHSRQLHSIDVLLADIACIVLWINPLIYIYRAQVKLDLEFLADEAALNSGLDARDYQLSLLRYSGMLNTSPAANAFFTSKIKQRIIMMNADKPGSRRAVRYLVLLPALLILSILVGFQKVGPAIIVKTRSLSGAGMISYKPKQVERPTPAEKIVLPQKPHNKISNTLVETNQPAAGEDNTNVYVDARTDTVKFTLVPDATGKRFKGIYVVDDKILSDDEIRAGIKPTGRLEMILANRPMLGVYSANDSSAIKKWGERARPGVFFVKARPQPTK